MRSDVTFVVTSCQRFDLLDRTLTSFFQHNDAPLARAVVVEDSSDGEGVHRVAEQFYGLGLEVIVNGARLGQHRSIDRVYGTVDTDYIFHCEDDWEFGRSGIIHESREILAAEPDVLMVLAREPMSRYMRSLKKRSLGSARYRRLPPHFHHKWYSFSFNPGLRRLKDYPLLDGGYAAFRSENAISQHYKALGWSIAALDDARVKHLGFHRSTGTHVPRWKRPYNELVEKPFYGLRRRMAHYARLAGLSDD